MSVWASGYMFRCQTRVYGDHLGDIELADIWHLYKKKNV